MTDKQAITMAQSNQNPNPEYWKPDTDQKTINLTIGTTHHKNPEENKQSYKHCYSNKLITNRCYYMNLKIAPEWFG